MNSALPGKPGFTSWSATPSGSASAAPAQPRSRLRQVTEHVSWWTVILVVGMLVVLDFCAFGIVGGGQAVRHCISGCGLATQAHLLRQARWLIPVITVLPVLLAFAVRRQRITVTVVQVLVCCLMLVQNARTLHRIEDELNGKVPCWNDAYSAADCPWGDRG